MVGLSSLSAAQGLLAWDVRFAYLPAAESVLHGHSPYPALDDPILDEQKGYVYPPQLLFVLLPLTVLPVPLAAGLVAAGMIALLLLTLRLLEVRDVRCYAAALLWVPAISGVLLSNLSIPLAFALAVMWRYRDSVGPSAIALGLSDLGQAAALADVRLDPCDQEVAHLRARHCRRRRRDSGRVGRDRLRWLLDLP